MNFVPDGTMFAGLYTCSDCGMRFLNTRIVPKMTCPYCGEDFDMEIGPDDVVPDNLEAAKLDEVIEGEENVALYDKLLNVAFESDDESWL